MTEDAAEAKQLVGDVREDRIGDGVRAYHILGRDRVPYVVVVNFSDAKIETRLPASPSNHNDLH